MEQEITQRRKIAYLNSVAQDDILKLLEDLEDIAEDSYTFMGKAWGMDLEEFHMLTNKIRASLPDELRQATRVASDSDKIVATARQEAATILENSERDAARIIEEAKKTALSMIETSDINRMAKAQAQEIMSSAESDARSIRRGADEYAREVLNYLEDHITKVVGTIVKSREQLNDRINIHDEEKTEPIIPMGRPTRR